MTEITEENQLDSDRMYYLNILFKPESAGVLVLLKRYDETFYLYKVGSFYCPNNITHREKFTGIMSQILPELPNVEGVVIRGSNNIFFKKEALSKIAENVSPTPLKFVSIGNRKIGRAYRADLDTLATDAENRKSTVIATVEDIEAIRGRLSGD
ncbi:hypothetical protein [Ornithinibacillus scapharcae]|uniref:hypothetical protein n=1 Tax=Ornithinibacillus scapharcae TaxID=1147159 RepID=UPI000225B2DF|nr:hypothetical protein [Ornithinibacillus scapharcae]